jgi:hypothetical protein
VGADNRYSELVHAYMDYKLARMFLLGNTIYGLMIGAPPFIVNGEDNEPKFLWFAFHRSKDDYIIVDNAVNLSDIIDLLDEDISDELIFNLDLFQ